MFRDFYFPGAHTWLLRSLVKLWKETERKAFQQWLRQRMWWHAGTPCLWAVLSRLTWSTQHVGHFGADLLLCVAPSKKHLQLGSFMKFPFSLHRIACEESCTLISTLLVRCAFHRWNIYKTLQKKWTFVVGSSTNCSMLIVLLSTLLRCNSWPVGANPHALSLYAAALQEDSSFQCFDGSFKLQSSDVNDNFCDCLDGSDEPGTAACAGLSNHWTLQSDLPGFYGFFCENLGSAARLLYTSHVGDGICDCCDGSDEPEAKCPNSCGEEGPAVLAQHRARAEDLEKGRLLRRQHEEEGLQKVIQWKEEKQSDKAELCWAFWGNFRRS